MEQSEPAAALRQAAAEQFAAGRRRAGYRLLRAACTLEALARLHAPSAPPRLPRRAWNWRSSCGRSARCPLLPSRSLCPLNRWRCLFPPSACGRRCCTSPAGVCWPVPTASPFPSGPRAAGRRCFCAGGLFIRIACPAGPLSGSWPPGQVAGGRFSALEPPAAPGFGCPVCRHPAAAPPCLAALTARRRRCCTPAVSWMSDWRKHPEPFLAESQKTRPEPFRTRFAFCFRAFGL